MSRKPFARLPGVLTAYGWNSRRLADVLKCSMPTARKYMRNPGKLKLEDLVAFNKAGIPADEIREAITFR